jgi:hypothetical protein
LGQTATATATSASGYVRRVILTNDGYDYTSTPNVTISAAPSGGINATAVAITTQKGGVHSVQSILLTNPGAGYVVPPIVTITGGNGSGAIAICEIVTDYYGTSIAQIQSFGNGYPVAPNVTFSSPSAGLAVTARGIVSISTAGSVTQILISDAGIGYTMNPVITISPPPIITGIGTFSQNEIVTGSISRAFGRVKTWNKNENILKVGTTDGDFVPGDIIVGSASSARYSVRNVSQGEFQDKYEQNDEIEREADLIIDFSESNPFGNY